MSSESETVGTPQGYVRTFTPELRALVETPITARFDAICVRFPDRTAVEVDGQTITYQDLCHAANGIARYLIDKDVAPTAPVGIGMGFGIPTLIAMLGCLKAGRMYTPLDLANPTTRLMYILEQTQASLILSDSASMERLQTLVGDRDSVTIQNVEDIPAQEGSPALDFSPDTWAAVYFTSGSTGLPTGIIRSHRNIMATVAQAIARFNLREGDQLAVTFSHATRASTTMIYGALLTGSTLHIYNFQEQDLSAFPDWLNDHHINVLHLVVTAYRMLVGLYRTRLDLPDLRTMIIAGEPVARDDVVQFGQVFPETSQLVNRLASTEAGQFAEHLFDLEIFDPDAPIPAGLPVEDSIVVLVDDDLNMLDPGEIGEIAVYGDMVSPGYWANPEMDSTRFVILPGFADRRFFLTGDLGTFRPDGALIHLGRKNLILKIRGYRISVAEIESRLRAHPGVENAAVWGMSDKSEQMRLIAYIVPGPEGMPRPSTLRAWLRESLAEYMIPAIFREIAALPRNVMGKIDYKALPIPDSKRPDLIVDYVPAADGLESMLVDIWEDLLDVQPIGIDDPFFDLGGSSLLASAVVAAIRERNGLDLSMARLSQAPTIRLLAELIRNPDMEMALPCMVPIQPQGSRPPLFCMHPRGGLVGMYHHLARHLGSDQPIYGLQARGLDGLTQPDHSIEDMAAHYIEEILKVQPIGPYYLTGFSLGGFIAHEAACQMRAQGLEIARLILLDAHRGQSIAGWVRRSRETLQHTVEQTRSRLGHLRQILTEEPVSAWGRLIRQGRQTMVEARAEQRAAEIAAADPFNQPHMTPESRVLWANRRAHDLYSPKVYDGDAIFILAADEGRFRRDPRQAWQPYVRGQLEVIAVPGSHRELIEGGSVSLLASTLQEILARPLGRTASDCG